MKMLNMKCPNCNANLTVAPDKTDAKCEHCGATFLIDDEHIHIDFDAEQAGYEFEKGRQRAQEEAGGIGSAEPESREAFDDSTLTKESETREEIDYPTPTETYTEESEPELSAKDGNSLRRIPPYAIVGLIFLLLIASIGIERGASRGSRNQEKETEEEVITTAEDEIEDASEVVDVEAADASKEDEENGSNTAENNEESDSDADGDTDDIDQTSMEQETVDGAGLKGRGFCDYEYREPQYVGVSGYIAIYKYDDAMLSFNEVPATPWYVPKYAKYGGRYIDTESKVEHKTKIKVLEQQLHYGDVAKYDGYLLVEDESGEQFYIDVDNFVTKDYWNFDNLEDALDVGYYVAEYHQRSDVMPVTHDSEPVYLEEGTKVFVRNFVPGEWSVITTKPDPDATPIEALVWGGWYDVNEYGTRGICFNTEDLTIVY